MSNMPPPYPGQEPYQGQGQQYPPVNPTPYGQPAGSQSPYGGAKPQHPQATTTLVLGIVSIVLVFMCCLPLGIAPWIMGSKAIKQVDANPGMYEGRGQLVAGKVMGIVSTVLFVVGIIVFVALFALIIASPEFQEELDAALAPTYNAVTTVSS